MDYLAISNLPIFWVLASVTVIISFVQALLYIRQSFAATKACNLDPALPKTAMRIGLVSAIGPAAGVFIVMVGLMASIGGPMAWMRLSIIGAAATELTAANLAAESMGLTLGGEGYGLLALAVGWFAMALNGSGWLILTGIATPALETMRDKMSGGDPKWLGVMSAACSIGIFGYLNANSAVNPGVGLKVAPSVTILISALAMIAINKLIVPKMPKLAEYALGIAMIIGIATGIIVG